MNSKDYRKAIRKHYEKLEANNLKIKTEEWVHNNNELIVHVYGNKEHLSFGQISPFNKFLEGLS